MFRFRKVKTKRKWGSLRQSPTSFEYSYPLSLEGCIKRLRQAETPDEFSQSALFRLSARTHRPRISVEFDLENESKCEFHILKQEYRNADVYAVGFLERLEASSTLLRGYVVATGAFYLLSSIPVIFFGGLVLISLNLLCGMVGVPLLILIALAAIAMIKSHDEKQMASFIDSYMKI